MAWNVRIPPAEFYDRSTPGHVLGALIEEVNAQPVVALDTETNGLTSWRCTPLFWSLAWGNRRVCMTADLMGHFEEVFEGQEKDWVFCNAKFDAHMLRNAGFTLAGRLVDTCVMHALLFEEKPHSLEFMGKEILGMQWKDLLEPWKKGLKRQYPDVGNYLLHVFAEDPKKLIEYASNDAYGTLKIYEALKEQLQREQTYTLYPALYPTMWDLFDKTEVPFTKVLWECETEGILLDTSQLATTSASMAQAIEQLDREIIRLVGRVVNPGSNPQMATYFFGDLKLRPLGMTDGGKTGVRKPQLDDSFLEHHAPDVPVAKLLRERRELSKSKSTYADGLPALVDRHGRLHTKFNQDVARTGRLSSSGPNLQNCLHPATELLTKSGWVRIDELPRGVEVAQWAASGEVSWAVPLAYPRRHYEGDLVTLFGRVRAAVTPDHRMVIQAGTQHWRECLAGNLPKCAVPTAGTLHGGRSADSAYLQFLVAIQADGSIRPKGKRYELRFGFKKERKIGRLAGILRELGLTDAFSCRRSEEGVTTFRGYVPPWVFDWLTIAKMFRTEALVALDLPSRHVFLDELQHWDGSLHSNGIIREYYTMVRENALAVLTVAAVSGVKASLGDNPVSGGGEGRRYNVRFLAGDPLYNINKEHIGREHYSGDVYCVTVPSDHILTRLDGRILVVKNCPNPESDKHHLREAFVPKPGHVLIAADYNALEMRLLAAASQAEDMIDLFLSGKDIHMGNASLVYEVPYDDIKAAKKRAGAVDDREVEIREAVAKSLSAPSPLPPLSDRERLMLEYRRKIKIVGFGQRKYRPKRNSLKTVNPKGLRAYGNAVLPGGPGSVSTWASDALNAAPVTEASHAHGRVDTGSARRFARRHSQCPAKVGKSTLNYGMKEGLLAVNLSCTREEAAVVRRRYLDRYPAVERFYEQSIAVAREYGYADSILGRRRFLPEIVSSKATDRWEAERQAVNMEIQGAAADVARMAMLRCRQADLVSRYDCRMLLQVHDEIVFECPVEEADYAIEEIKLLMEHPFPTELAVPLTVSCKKSDRSWAHTK